MTPRLLSILLLTLFVPGLGPRPAVAQASPAPSPQSVQVSALDPATTLAVVEDHRVPLVEVQLSFPAGTYSPFLQRTHAREAFESQLADPAGALARRADALSTSIHLEVGDRASTLLLSCLKDDLPEALRLLRDVLHNRDFDHGDLVRRRFSQTPLFQANEKDPTFRLLQKGARLLYPPDDPRRRSYEPPPRFLTDPRRLAEARDALVRLPGRIIAFAGDLSLDEAARLSAGLLPPALPAPADLAPVFPAVLPPPPETTERMPLLNQVYLGLFRACLPVTDPDFPALLLANHVMGGHFYSRLYTALRHEGGETYSPFDLFPEEPEPAAYTLVAYTRAANAPLTEAKLRAVLRDLHDRGITEDERRAAAGYLLGHLAIARASPGKILDRFLWERERGLPPGFRDRLADRAAALSLDRINAVIRRFYDPARFSLLRVAPR